MIPESVRTPTAVTSDELARPAVKTVEDGPAPAQMFSEESAPAHVSITHTHLSSVLSILCCPRDSRGG